jgi:ssDNA-binding Zn-finger/Zn-ribbon topoisomerase 1
VIEKYVKDCPDCAGFLVLRTNSLNGTEFLGCSSYPSCKHTEPIPESWRMRQMGAQEFPFFDEEVTH